MVIKLVWFSVQAFAAGWLFYQSLLAFAIIPVYVVYAFLRDKKKMQKKQQEQLNEQFRETLGYIKEVLQTGAALEQAVTETAKSMTKAYGEKGMLAEELNLMVRQMYVGIPLEKSFSDFAYRSCNEDIKSFAEVLVIARKSGGGIRNVILYTERILREKQETLRQISILLHAKEYETGVLKMMPFGIIGYFLIFLPEFLTPLYHSLAGVIVMSALLLLYVFLCYLTDRLSDISV